MGAGPADRRDAAGSLAGDEGARPGLERPGRPGDPGARHRRTGGWTMGRPEVAVERAAGGRPGAGPPGRTDPRGWRRRGWPGRSGRVDDHRRIAARRAGVGDRVVAGTVATDSSLRVRVGGGGRATPRSPASADWSPKRRRPRAVPRRWPTGLPRCCSTSRWRRRRSRSRCGPGSATHGRCDRADGDGAGHRVSPRARSGDPAGHRHLDRDVGSDGHPGEGSAGAGADASGGRRPVRQDGDAHRAASRP